MVRTARNNVVVRGLALGFSSKYRIDRHSHDWHQLIYARRGVLTVVTDREAWVVPPARAVLVPAGIEHEIEMSGPTELRTLYFHPDSEIVAQVDCRVVPVSDLFRELIVRVIERKALSRADRLDSSYAALLASELSDLGQRSLRLPMPNDPRAVRFAESLKKDPADVRSVDELAHAVGASRRTLERLFRHETDMTVGEWRARLRLLEALKRLARDEPVSSVSLAVGYESPSAFISMFRKVLGTTPGKYFATSTRRSESTTKK